MDKSIAASMTSELAGKTIGGWLVLKYINHGKSAVVFLAEKAGDRAALKVFDPELVQRYSRDSQINRIEREKTLIGKSHPNLIRIFDGGEDGQYLFVAMEYFESQNLAEALPKIPKPQVRSIISQIASAAQFLEDSSLAHRDIKPENIGLAPDMKTAKLLDLGVIRPFDLSTITDEGEQRYFIGTLQYSPPELLFREEEQSIEGWRAVTFYQLGGVLHDLLMRKPLFDDFKNPYARLVRAVEREIPNIDSEADADLRLLAQNCLAKAPRHRLETIKWENFSQPEAVDPLDEARRRIAQRRFVATQISSMHSEPAEDLRQQTFILRSAIQSAVVNTCTTESLPRYSLSFPESKEEATLLSRTLFKPSPKDGLNVHLAIYCQGAVLVEATNLRELRLWACVSQEPKGLAEKPSPTAPSLAIKGPLIDQDVLLHVRRFFVLAYAEALDYKPKGTEYVDWLKIGGDR